MLEVLDLFCGMGGLSSGFGDSYRVTGVDNNDVCGRAFRFNGIGDFKLLDLASTYPEITDGIVVAGPSCRPWSALNVQKRRKKHPDHVLLGRFFLFILKERPPVFLMENVTRLSKDGGYRWWCSRLRNAGYFLTSHEVQYSDWGAATGRHRLITIGFLDDEAGLSEFLSNLELEKRQPVSVADAVKPFLGMVPGSFPDHEWPQFKTIERYAEKYAEAKFGWYKPVPNLPAPSFGNVAKTYFLHPFAGENGVPLRVISVREAMAIMGFPDEYEFPPRLGLSPRYQMVADAVSPKFSRACAHALLKVLA